jgi:hypothetical protein
MKLRLHTVWLLIKWSLYLSFGWIVGVFLLVRGLVRALGHWRRARRAMAPTTACPWCRADVSQYGPYSCPQCHTRTLDWAWRCGNCGAWVGHIDCPECGLSVVNPLMRGR